MSLEIPESFHMLRIVLCTTYSFVCCLFLRERELGLYIYSLMDVLGIEPGISCMPNMHTATELYPPLKNMFLF